MADPAKKFEALLDFFDDLLILKGLSSREHFLPAGGKVQPVFQEVSLTVRKGEIWAFYSPSLITVKLLLETACNLAPAASGQPIFLQKKTPGKRQLPDNIFYIDSTGMLYEHMNPLEAVMLATAKKETDPVIRQNEIFETLIDLGMGHLSLTPIYFLSAEEKALIELVIAFYSPKRLMVFNLPECIFDDILLEALARLSDRIAQQDRALIVGTGDADLVEKTASHAACIIGGSLVFQGTVEELRQYDRTLMTIRDEELEWLKEKLTELYPFLHYEADGDQLWISGGSGSLTDPSAIQETMVRQGLLPRQVTLNHRTAQRAMQALGEDHDLP